MISIYNHIEWHVVVVYDAGVEECIARALLVFEKINDFWFDCKIKRSHFTIARKRTLHTRSPKWLEFIGHELILNWIVQCFSFSQFATDLWSTFHFISQWTKARGINTVILWRANTNSFEIGSRNVVLCFISCDYAIKWKVAFWRGASQSYTNFIAFHLSNGSTW